MKARYLRQGALSVSALAVLLISSAFALEGAGAAQTETLHGLEVKASAVTRGKRVSLQDCPPGENIVRGVIRPNEDNEFVTVSIDVKVLSSFSPVEIEKPLLYDASGNEYKTAQSFRDLDAEPAYTCQFSFRVPSGTEVARFEIQGTSFDLSSLSGEP